MGRCGCIPFKFAGESMKRVFIFNVSESEESTESSVLIESFSGLDGKDLLCALFASCSRFRLLCSFSFKCARIWALNSFLSEYSFPHIVQVDGLSGDVVDDKEGNDEEESAKEEEESASEHEDAAGEAATAGEAGEEDADDRAVD